MRSVPAPPPRAPGNLPARWLDIANQAARTGDRRRAMRAYGYAVKASESGAVSTFGRALEDWGLHRQAANLYLEHVSGHPWLWRRVEKVAGALRDDALMETALRGIADEALRKQTYGTQDVQYLALHLQRTGRAEEAAALLERGGERDRSHWFAYGEMWTKRGDAARALRGYSRAAEKGHVGAQVMLAARAWESGDTETARQRWIELANKYPPFFLSLAVMEEAAGNVGGALAAYASAAEAGVAGAEECAMEYRKALERPNHPRPALHSAYLNNFATVSTLVADAAMAPFFATIGTSLPPASL